MSTSLNVLSAFFVLSGIFIAIYIAFDVYKKPQSMKIMNIVWILTGLWGSYLALYAYKTIGSQKGDSCQMKDMESMDMTTKDMDMKDMDMKGMGMKDMNMNVNMNMNMNMNNHQMKEMPMMGMEMKMDGNKPHWQSIALSALHCGAGCTLADIIGESLTHYFPITIASSSIIGSWVFDTVLALIIGVFFQFFAIREMQKISVSGGLFKAFKADVFSLLSWQIGMYGWMAIVYFVIFKDGSLDKLSFTFWFMMQIAMLFGFVFAYPMNALLLKLGIKKGM